MTYKYFWLFYYYYYYYYLLHRSFGTSGYWCHFFSYFMTKLMSVPSICLVLSCLVLSCLFFSFLFFSPNMILYSLMSVPFICLLMSFHRIWDYFLYPTLFLHPLSTYPRIHPYINLPSSCPLCLCLYLSHDLSHSLHPFISISHYSIEI